MSSGAFLPATKIFDMAIAGICWIDEARKPLNEERLARAMQPRLFGLLRGRTQEEADKYLRGLGWRVDYPTIQWGWAYERFNEIGGLCCRAIQAAGDGGDGMVFITAEDHEVLNEFANRWQDWHDRDNDV